MKNRFLAVILAMLLLLLLCACDDETAEYEDSAGEELISGEETGEAPESADTGTEGGDSWSIYWYLCGSDLESEGGFATEDLSELTEVELPENVQVVIETGGASQWQNDFVSADMLQRYVYNSEGLQLVDEQPSANMGEASTLAEFLSYASENYPADRTAVVFWNHGGGSVSGAAFDELYDNDSLQLDEMHEAFSSAFSLDESNPPLELVGFDTCLMATVDVASTFTDIAKYFVASEETEPANGWLYSGWISALAEDPSMDGAALGEVICDTYYEGCEEVGTQDDATLSLTDLSKLGTLLDAYETFGTEAFTTACEDTGFFSQFGRVAAQSENYGGNTREQGYTNMVDLGHLARESSDLLTTHQDVLDALDECVLYKVNGQYRSEASGLSCYYSYNGDIDDFEAYSRLGTGTSFKSFFSLELTGGLDESGEEFAAEQNIETLPEVQDLTAMSWDGAALDLDDEGTASLDLGPEANDILAGIGFSLYYVDEESDTMMMLGTDNDLTSDWENGVFYDNFRGVWGSIDGNLVYMELSYEGDDYNLYSVPILLNGEEYNLQVVYSFTDEEWIICGARQGIDDNGMADKELRLLEDGDEISTIWYMATASGDDDFEPYIADTITYSEDTEFYESDLPDGSYSMVFQMWDAMGNTAYSSEVVFDCSDGEIMTSIYE